MPKTPFPILHFASLAAMGGVERNFVRLLAYEDPERTLVHGLVTPRGIHPMILPGLEGRVRRFHPKRLGPLKVPDLPGVRRANFRRIGADYREGVALLWNRLGKLYDLEVAKASGLFSVHWERGWAWTPVPEDEARRYLSGIDAALANSHAGRRFLQLGFGYEGEVELAPITILPEALHPRVDPVIEGRLILGCCSRLLDFKGVSQAVRSVFELSQRGRDVELRIAGAGPFRSSLEALVGELHLEDRVRFLGEIDDTASFYDGLHLLLHLALREPAGGAVLEAQARGCPVIAGRVDGMPEAVEEGAGGTLVPARRNLSDFPELADVGEREVARVYDPDDDVLRPPGAVDPKDVADAVERYLDDPRRYARDSEAGPRRIAERYDPERVSRALIDTLVRLRGERG